MRFRLQRALRTVDTAVRRDIPALERVKCGQVIYSHRQSIDLPFSLYALPGPTVDAVVFPSIKILFNLVCTCFHTSNDSVRYQNSVCGFHSHPQYTTQSPNAAVVRFHSCKWGGLLHQVRSRIICWFWGMRCEIAAITTR